MRVVLLAVVVEWALAVELPAALVVVEAPPIQTFAGPLAACRLHTHTDVPSLRSVAPFHQIR